ncbi:NGG1p interacting factor NIF3 [Sulfurimonas paralvinellae]|uniref:NGG1p interacting factor NIF3 n=1 Tax=Sulfurimonas paralvinellae TaxID=317658 RepID=A0A7M1B951_9BACT|nr:NGG1p interacting factor NIF3 [Sulfurimonas paralvinellae]QOP46161.1 NGG1p interacting factor NIF3 [Sulfurimonas paralvinellae]
MYKLSYYVPEVAKEKTKSALFAAGAGMFENYENCSFETLGQGQFKPIGNANPYIGKKGVIEYVAEYKVEMICRDELIKKAVEVLKEAHPYEEVAYEVIKLEDF